MLQKSTLPNYKTKNKKLKSSYHRLDDHPLAVHDPVTTVFFMVNRSDFI